MRFVRAQRSFNLLRLARRAWGAVGAAFDEMRDALAGRNYVADYVQTLTHEVKSPLSAIRGAAELLQEPMPDADRARFAGNIARETQRIQELVDRMMELTTLESRRSLDAPAPVAMRGLLQEVAASAQARATARGLQMVLEEGAVDATVEGDAFLLQRALANWSTPRSDFSPPGGRHARAAAAAPPGRGDGARPVGPASPIRRRQGVREVLFARAAPFQQKSTGLGLSFVKEIAELHEGRITAVECGRWWRPWPPCHCRWVMTQGDDAG